MTILRVTRTRLLAAGVIAVAVLITWASVHRDDAPLVPAGQMDPAKWIVAEAAGGQNTGVTTDGIPAAVAPPREVADGPGSRAVATYLHKLAPAGSTVRTMTDYPDLHAAMAWYTTPAGDVMELAVQRLTRPMTVEEITLRPGSAGLSDLPSGSQKVELRKTDPAGSGVTRQLVVVTRPAGVSITFTVVSQTPGGPVSFNTTQLDALVANAVKTVDVAAMDALLK